ncbi:MAG: hypothetical protein CO119_07405 [Flavobacteriales bacterium CG_4_9_14_3_um_filter_40_17]|nr:MAG: hypothetical protein CO119_07405 [Flavobacteriales bacterium CG_4_9_14_3_um_filter_40_17]
MKKIYFFIALMLSLSSYSQSVGILGDGVPGHGFADADLNLNPVGDGVNFVLMNVTLTTAANGLKFRQDDAWTTNWANTQFPNGRGFLSGVNIPTTAGTYDIYFHIDTFNGGNSTYSFQPAGTMPSVGILGDAVVGHSFAGPDLVMTTTDGINYTLDAVDLISGGMKFRQDGNWNINWGGSSFPNGTGEIDSANNIPVTTAGTSGKFDITFNRNTNEFTFTESTLSLGDFTNAGIQAQFIGSNLVVKGLNEEATISGYDLLGRKLFSFKRDMKSNFQENLPLPKNQIGLVRIESSSFQKTLKVVPQ